MAAAAAVIPFLSVDDYLHSAYSPDVDYVDGALEERNLGEWDHADLQGELTALFRNNRTEWSVRTVPEIRVQVAPTRFRVPDLCVMPASWTKTQIVRVPPLLCIEVLSPEDTFHRIRARAQDFLRMGVPEVWIFDPIQRKVSVLRGEDVAEWSEGMLRLSGTAIELDLQLIFAVLDQD